MSVGSLRTEAMLDVVAATLTPDVIVPFEVPARPIQLGRREVYCIRSGYVAREAVTQSDRANTHPGVQAIVLRLVESFGADRVRTSLDELSRQESPASFLRALAVSLRDDDVLLISTSVRALTMVFDQPGPPDDPTHYREWTFPELHAFLDAEGVDVVFGGMAVPVASDSSSGMAVMVGISHRPSRQRRTP